MKKRWMYSCIILSLTIVGSICSYFVFFKIDPQTFLTKEELADPNLLKSTRAVLYFSTTADQDMHNDGISYAVFIDTDGKARLWKMEGLELGTVFAANDMLLLEDKKNIHIIGEDGLETITMPIAEYTGEVTGFNPKDGKFYSVYNSGFTSDGGYHSNIRIGNVQGFDTIHIPYYLHSSGITETDLLMLTDEGDMSELTLQKMPLQAKVKISKIASLEPGEDRVSVSSILQAKDNYYIVMSNLEKLTIGVYRINEQTFKIDVFPLYKYKNQEEFQVRIPYNVRNSADIANGVLYYVDGVGDVYSFDLETEQAKKEFTLVGASVGAKKMSEQTYFEGEHLHFYRYHEESKSRSIDTYNLRTGKLVEELSLTGIEEMYAYTKLKSKRISAYDFIVLPK